MITFEIKKNYPLSTLTSWQIGGQAEYFCSPRNITEIRQAYEWAHENQFPVTLLGGGSNVLVSDLGVKGLVISLRSFSGLEVIDDQKNLEIKAYSGTGKSDLLKVFLKYKVPAALFLSGLPGDLGGGVVMNAGVSENIQPREFCEIIDWIHVLKPNGEMQKFAHKDIHWEYRKSKGWQPGIVVEVGIKVPLVTDPEILNKVREANRQRLSKQPLDLPSCGSVFKNPEGHKAAQLIDQCGLKGKRIGDAQVSLKHANFIVNLNQATAKDTWELIQLVRAEVKQRTSVELNPEVVRLGEWP